MIDFVVLFIAWYLTSTAARLDRLHIRETGALAALEAAMVRRAEASLELANSGLLDGATALLLATGATDSLHLPEDAARSDREAVESDLTAAIGVVLEQSSSAGAALSAELAEGDLSPDGVAHDELAEDELAKAEQAELDHQCERLRNASERVKLSRQIYNDAVTDVRIVRRRRLVRTFRLAGHTTALPEAINFNDRLP